METIGLKDLRMQYEPNKAQCIGANFDTNSLFGVMVFEPE
jgi:hypothetical protein